MGANAVIGPGLELGEFSMVGMGSVVTRTIPPHGLVVGNPARLVAWVCACGPTLVRLPEWKAAPIDTRYGCERCKRVYTRTDTGLREIEGPPE